jgi:CBS domain-containing protein
MNKISEHLKNNSHLNFVSVSPSASVQEAIEVMNENDVGAVLVVEKDKFYGIFSERDAVRKVLMLARWTKETKVYEVMQTNIIYISPENTFEECLAVMAKLKVRHIPVLEQGKLMAFLSIKEVASKVIESKEYTIAELTKFITGSPYYSPPKISPRYQEVRYYQEVC